LAGYRDNKGQCFLSTQSGKWLAVNEPALCVFALNFSREKITMSDLKTTFETAAAAAKKLPARPNSTRQQYIGLVQALQAK